MTFLKTLSVVFVLMLFLVPAAFAQTPDTQTPAEEEACDKYVGEGARYGLCIAYCEAQDCDNTKFSNPSCSTIAERFIAYSVKQGYVKGPKDKPVITCRVSACTPDDVKYCGGVERDCDTNGDRICEEICTSRLVGFSGEKPLCEQTPCRKCVGEVPGK